MQIEQQKNLQHSIALGWIALAIISVMISLSSLMQAAMNTDFSDFAFHPAPRGWAVICVLFSVTMLMGVFTRIYSAVWFRWLNATLLALVTLFMLAHHLGHMAEGKVYGLFGAVDVAHHVIGFLMSFLAVRWARGGKLQAERSINDAVAA
jgi:hypothetical protein